MENVKLLKVDDNNQLHLLVTCSVFHMQYKDWITAMINNNMGDIFVASVFGTICNYVDIMATYIIVPVTPSAVIGSVVVKCIRY